MVRARATAETYGYFMEEIKLRVDEIYRRLPRLTNEREFEGMFEAEFCYVQLRLACELIALASLVAHHSYGVTKGLLKVWNPDKIFAALEQINPRCFPSPVRLELDRAGRRIFFDEPDRAMTRSALKKIYADCGRMLHRGALKHTLEGAPRTYDIRELVLSVQAVARLIAEHQIFFPKDGRRMMVCLHGGDNGETVVLVLKEEEPS